VNTKLNFTGAVIPQDIEPGSFRSGVDSWHTETPRNFVRSRPSWSSTEVRRMWGFD
jgi:hypothetical protein